MTDEFEQWLNGSRHPNMKELRPAKTIRVMFAFDPRRTAILLIGGDKAGQPQQRWYKRMIAKADTIDDRHLAGLAGKESR